MAEVTPAMPASRRVLLRLFVIQAAWNYERMQGIGFGYAAEPALRHLAGGPAGEKYRQALARESQFFNAHPYLAGLAVGAAIRAEFDGQPKERIERLREALCGPLGSIGDRLFWASWLPICAALGLMLFVFGARVWAAIAFLVLYNAAHLYCRVWSLRVGWERGMQVAGAMSTPVLRASARLAAPAAGVMVGLALPLAFGWQLVGAASRLALIAGALAVAVAVTLRLLRGRAGGVVVTSLLLVATWVLALLWR